VPDSKPKPFASNAYIKTRRGSPSVSPQKINLSKLNLADNVLGLAEVGDFEAPMFKFTIMFIRIPNAQITTIAPILANPC
jgi:hypothetical protein